MLNTWILFQILRKLRRVEFKLNKLGVQMATDYAVLQAKMVEVDAKVAESEATLLGLAAEVVRLKEAIQTGDQATVDAVVAHAQAIVDRLTVTEDTADDQLPVTPPPVDPPVA